MHETPRRNLEPRESRRKNPNKLLRTGAFLAALGSAAVCAAVTAQPVSQPSMEMAAYRSITPVRPDRPVNLFKGLTILPGLTLHMLRPIQSQLPKNLPKAAEAPATTTAPPATTTTTEVPAPQPATPPAPETRPTVIEGSNVTDAFTPDWWRCVITPESGGSANTPGTGGLFGFTYTAWQSSPYAEVWQSQEPAAGAWSMPWEAPASVQAEDALVLYDQNGGFGPSAWNNSANCGKSG